ncbi:MAG: ABC transporter ATP-binding protein [Firmicutes bacterium]|nr:ABC transporter ATP-binding protein [Bacillota bacterium]
MRKLFRYLKPFTAAIIAVFVLTFLQAISQLYLPNLMSQIVDIGIVNGDTAYILATGLRMLLVAAIGAACTISAGYLTARTGAGYGRTLRELVFERVEEFSLYEFDKIGTASLITRTTNDITQMQQVVMMLLRMTLRAPMMFVGGIIMAVSKDARLSLLLIGALPTIAFTLWLISVKGMPMFRAMQTKLDKLNLILRENLTGIRVIRAFNRNQYEHDRFNDANYDLTSTAVRVNRLMAIMNPIINLTFNFMTLAIIWYGGIRIDGGNLQVGDLMAFVQYAMQILSSLMMITMIFVMLPRAAVSAARINEVLDTVPAVVDPLVGEEPTQRGYLEFRNVTFSYPGAEQPAVQNISFQAGPGETTAIIGGTGSGKSTLLNLIMRFYDVDSGSILVGGVDVREMKQADLRAKIGFVPQQAVLFTGTVADNIRYGKEDATDAEVEAAADIAQAAEFITGMPAGFDSLIAQGGTNVSGGQKQRLSIARALVRRPEIYLFDDSFSALDFRTDARLRAALKNETRDATVIIVAQRVSTVMDADRIIVLQDGRIVGMGRHRELLATCSVYRDIVASQLSEEELA